MLKRQFVSRVSAVAKMAPEQITAVLAALQSVAAEELAESGEARIPGIATMKVMPRSERAARNPKTGVPCMITPGHTVKSRPVTMLSQLVIKNIEKRPIGF